MIFIRLFLIIYLFVANSNVLAHTTNINEVTDLFEHSVPNKDQYISDLEGIRSGGISNIEQGESLKHIKDIEKSELEAVRLNSIRAVDLDEAGRKARQSEDYSFYDKGEFEPDLTKPGNKEHKEDVLKIVNATTELLTNLTGKLKELGVDCKTVKGAKQKDPIYTIEVKREAQRNTEYDQFFCEEPRNQYKCTDSVSLSCKRKGMKWEEWEHRIMTYSGHDLHNQHGDWMISVFWKETGSGKTKYKGLIKAGAATSIRKDIEVKLGAREGQVEIIVPPAPQSNIFFTPHHTIGDGAVALLDWPRDRYRVFHSYNVPYKFREGEEICEEWAEDWTERCTLQ